MPDQPLDGAGSADAPFLHAPSDSIRFSVVVDGVTVRAAVPTRVLHFRYCPLANDDDPMDTFRAHAAELAAALRRRLAAGSIDPVLLREFDLREPGV